MKSGATTQAAYIEEVSPQYFLMQQLIWGG